MKERPARELSPRFGRPMTETRDETGFLRPFGRGAPVGHSALLRGPQHRCIRAAFERDFGQPAALIARETMVAMDA